MKWTMQQQQINPIARETNVWRVDTISTFLPISHKDAKVPASVSLFFTYFRSNFFIAFYGVRYFGEKIYWREANKL